MIKWLAIAVVVIFHGQNYTLHSHIRIAFYEAIMETITKMVIRFVRFSFQSSDGLKQIIACQ